MSDEVAIVESFQYMEQVVAEHLKGTKPTDIAKTLGITRAAVLNNLDQWKLMIANDTNVHVRAREALATADEHYNMIINRAWETVEQADSAGVLAAKTQALKLAADTEKSRLEMLHRAGLLENTELANQVLETERKQKIVEGIIREVVADCNHCKVEVAKRLQEITGRVEAIRVE